MKIRNKGTEVNQGFSQRDQNYLRNYDNAAADPAIIEQYSHRQLLLIALLYMTLHQNKAIALS